MNKCKSLKIKHEKLEESIEKIKLRLIEIGKADKQVKGGKS